jgi:hypothetical protein
MDKGREIHLPHCERCSVNLGARLDRGKHWSYKDKKWLDLCERCAHWLLHEEWREGLAPRRDFGHNT